MKKGTLIILILMMLSYLVLPTMPVKAGPGSNPLLHLSFCGSQFHFESDDYPTLYYDNVRVYDSGGAFVETITVYGHNAEWIDVGFTIGHVEGQWGEAGYGIISETWAVTSTCAGNGLINMYVYYSATPFYGNTHTMTIYSAQGFPSKALVTGLAGGTLPEGFEYGAPACWGTLYDDGTDMGKFDCDGFLAGVGERRAYLRNDPQGPDLDLLPKIQKYLNMLEGLGLTPQLP